MGELIIDDSSSNFTSIYTKGQLVHQKDRLIAPPTSWPSLTHRHNPLNHVSTVLLVIESLSIKKSKYLQKHSSAVRTCIRKQVLGASPTPPLTAAGLITNRALAPSTSHSSCPPNPNKQYLQTPQASNIHSRLTHENLNAPSPPARC